MQIYRHKFEATPKIKQNSIAHDILTTESNILKEFAERALSGSRIPSKANIFGREGVLNGRNSSYKSYNWFLTDLNAGSPLKLRERKRERDCWRSSSGGGDPKREIRSPYKTDPEDGFRERRGMLGHSGLTYEYYPTA